MSARDKNQQWKRFTPFFGLAVLVHLALFPLLPPFDPVEGSQLAKSRPIEVSLVPRTGQMNPRKQDKRVKLKPKEKIKKEKMPAGQIVNLPSTPDAEEPENSRFLAKTNAKTEKETKSRHTTTKYKNAGNEWSQAKDGPKDKSSSIQAEQPVKLVAPKGSISESKAKKTQETGKFELPSMKLQDALQLELDSDLGKLVNRQSQSKIDGKGNALRLYMGSGEKAGDGADNDDSMAAGTNLPNLIPSYGVLARLDSAPASDHLKDVEEGEGTFLNARRFKYASFFNRVHKGVSNAWEPLRELRRRDPRGQVYGRATRVTVLNVTLNADGDLTKVHVARSSGIGFLDQEAIYAFQRAQPFPNPPAGLLEDKAINFNFGFNFDIFFFRTHL